MKISELNYVITINGEETEFSLPEGARFRYFVNGGDGTYSIIQSSRFVELRVPLEKQLGLTKLDYTHTVDNIKLIHKLTKEVMVDLGNEKDKLGYLAASIISDEIDRVEEVMTVPFLIEEQMKQEEIVSEEMGE